MHATPLLTIDAVAEVLGVSRSTVRRLWADGAICKPIRVGRRGIRWRSADLQDFIARRPPAEHPAKETV